MAQEKSSEPLRGEAKWKAQKQQVADRNDAAFRRGRERRAAQDALADRRRREYDARDRAIVPEQPEP